MFENEEIKNLLYFGHLRNKMLFELKPSVFGNEFSNLESELWGLFHEELEELNKTQNNLNKG